MTSPSLHGCHIVVTRSADQADPFAEMLRALGATPLLVPSIQSVPTRDPIPLDAAVHALDGARWAVFTSPSGVRHGTPSILRVWPDGPPARVAVVGPGTAAAAAKAGLNVSFMPSEASGDALAAELPLDAGDRVVLFRSDIARKAVAEHLQNRGADVLDAVAYRTVEGAQPSDVIRALAHQPDAITFTSPSTVRGFLDGLAQAVHSGASVHLSGAAIVAIGPTTADALTEAGLQATAVATPTTLRGLTDALVRLFA
ncbi:MAG: uroporphyrinogen-III synthase [Bacteroidota bacterium]